MTDIEKEFLKYLKRSLLFSGIAIKSKESLLNICRHNGIPYRSQDRLLLSEVEIDFTLYRNKKLIAGIEIIDESDELNASMGRRLLINTTFKSIDCEFFRIVDLDNISEAAKIVSQKVRNL